MSELNYPLPVIGEESLTADPRTLEALQHIKTWGAGAIDSTNLKAEGVETASIKKEAITESKLDSAVAALLNAKTAGLSVVPSSTSLEGSNGHLYSFTGSSSVELKLPKPTINATVGVFNFLNLTSNFVTVSSVTNGGTIFTAGGGKTSYVLTRNEALTLQGDGSNWIVTAGEVKPEAVWTTGEASEGTPSTSRPAEIAVHSQASTGTGEFKLSLAIGGVTVGVAKMLQDGTVHVGANLGPYRVPPGLTWKVTGTNNEAIFYSQLLL